MLENQTLDIGCRTKEELDHYDEISWWLEGFLQVSSES